mmetsp:Transcript_46064/g.81035  ORF Transcript_46064/g.81035 Transcript_46064/m.81035 type:complete len:310 (+) Transcript_46064:82-1011(+)
MASAKLALIALLFQAQQMSLAAFTTEDEENCSNHPVENAGAGQHVMLQHSELHRIVASGHVAGIDRTHSIGTKAIGIVNGSKAMGLVNSNKSRRINYTTSYTLVGKGQCTDEDGTTTPKMLGWATCTGRDTEQGKPLGSIFKDGHCASLDICKSECDAAQDCGAFNWLSGHCWLYQELAKPYVKSNTEFDWFDCYVRDVPTTTTTTTTAFTGAWFASAPNDHCTETCVKQGKVCNEAMLSVPYDKAKVDSIASSLGYTCSNFRDIPMSNSPAIYLYEDQMTCVWKLTDEPNAKKCGAMMADYARFCPCG